MMGHIIVDNDNDRGKLGGLIITPNTARISTIQVG